MPNRSYCFKCKNMLLFELLVTELAKKYTIIYNKCQIGQLVNNGFWGFVPLLWFLLFFSFLI